MKKAFSLIILVLILASLWGCTVQVPQVQVLATTMPVYTFCRELCQGTSVQVGQLIQDNVSCLHDYTLQVNQMKAIEGAQIIVINGGGLEDFLSDALDGSHTVIDSSLGIQTTHRDHAHHDDHHGHDHGADAHFWLSPACAKEMARNICDGLVLQFPEYKDTFAKNLEELTGKLDELQYYGESVLAALSTRDLITFHDGFSYFAESFDLHILAAIEEEAGSETSAARLISLAELVEHHSLTAVFTEKSGSTASANIIAAETGVAVYALDMGISQGDYFEVMYHNIDTIKEALG